MRLSALLADLDVISVHGDCDLEVRAVTRDSREAGPNDLFVAIEGDHVDGHDFVAKTQAGAVVVQRPVNATGTLVQVVDTRLALAQLAAALHGQPAQAMAVVGLTGTNGKTTTATLVDEALRAVGGRVGRVGTTGSFIDGVRVPSALTTPEAPDLHALFARMRDAGVEVVVMEVSSIGLVQRRVDAIPFTVGVFTNLTRDHLDFHGTMENYTAAKARLFSELLRPVGGAPRALLCSDDPAWRAMEAPQDHWRYGFDADAKIQVLSWRSDARGSQLTMRTPQGDVTFSTPLVGRFNALNLAAALGVLLLLGLPLSRAVEGLEVVRGVPGRLEPVPNSHGLLVLVDYAHTPDALSAAIDAAADCVPGELWVVFGCGGDRDRGKRPEMGRAAEAAQHVVVTSDNPRSEPPLQIIADILQGMERAPDHSAADRGAAIAWVLGRASSGDVVLIAGKGHEVTQEIAGVKHAFDDRIVARRVLEAL